MSTACISPLLISRSTRALYHQGMKMFIWTMHISAAIGWPTIGRFRERAGGGFSVQALKKIVNFQWQAIHYGSKSTQIRFFTTTLTNTAAPLSAPVGKQTEHRPCLPPSSLPAPPWTWAPEIFHQTPALDLRVCRGGQGGGVRNVDVLEVAV